MDIVLRPARAEDVDALLILLNQLFEIESDFSFNEDRQRQGLELMLSERRNRCVLVAEVAGSVIGMASAQALISTAEGDYVGLIEDVVVHRDYRGEGVGKKLLAALETWAERHGLTRLQLLADRSNQPALRFYSKAGWSETKMIALRKALKRS